MPEHNHTALWHANKTSNIARDRLRGNTHTNAEIARNIVRLLHDNPFFKGDGLFLEPCVGAGAFVFAVLDHAQEHGFKIPDLLHRIHVMDNDIAALEEFQNALKTYLKDHHLSEELSVGIRCLHSDAVLFQESTRYSLILTNPPYVAAKTLHQINPKLSTEYHKRHPNCDTRSDLYHLIHHTMLEHIAENGECIFLCSDSWCDAQFGASLRTLITTNHHLTNLYTWRLYPLFRDDTSAILTRIRHGRGDTLLHSTDDSGGQNNTRWRTTALTRKRLTDLCHTEPLALRNTLILLGPEGEMAHNLLNDIRDKITPLHTIFSLHATPRSINDLAKNNLIDPKGTVPLFWQIQARVNRTPDYCHNPDTKNLPLITEDTAKEHKIPKIKNPLFLSGIIDRFPLFFTPKGTFGHVSKYIRLESSVPHDVALPLLCSWTSLLGYEITLKEGTRKTLRKRAHGLTKEIRLKDLAHVPILNPNFLTEEHKKRISLSEHRFQNQKAFILEEVIQDPLWQEQQNILFDIYAIGQEQQRTIMNVVLSLYWRRMRNIAEITKDKHHGTNQTYQPDS